MRIRRGYGEARARTGTGSGAAGVDSSAPKRRSADFQSAPHLRLPLGGRWKRGGRPDSAQRRPPTGRHYDGLAQDTSPNLCPSVLRPFGRCKPAKCRRSGQSGPTLSTILAPGQARPNSGLTPDLRSANMDRAMSASGQAARLLSDTMDRCLWSSGRRQRWSFTLSLPERTRGCQSPSPQQTGQSARFVFAPVTLSQTCCWLK